VRDVSRHGRHIGFPLLEALGSPRIERASEVEYNHRERLWVATCARTGARIAQGKNRSEVIAMEIEYLERRLA